MIDRIYNKLIRKHFESNEEMLFLMGPRQVGKTTSSLTALKRNENLFYFNWDNPIDRLKILEGPAAIVSDVNLDIARTTRPIVIFDELHKHHEWKNFLKGFFDTYRNHLYILVTGSARLDVFRKGGDSLMGRYFLYRLHPLSIGEILDPSIQEHEIRSHTKEIDSSDFNDLWNYGGFPAPFIKKNQRYYNKWKNLRHQQLFREDIRDLSNVHEIGKMEILAELIRQQAGQLSSYSSFAKKIRVSVDTIRRWIGILESFYYCYSIKPWSKNISRSLLKKPKYYLWDWSLVDDGGARLENFIASHLLKAIQLWTDEGFGLFDLYFIRTKEGHEVDFLVTRDGTPWFLIEVKSSLNKNISPELVHYHKTLKTLHSFQIVLNMEYIDFDCFKEHRPIIVPLKTFLSLLP